MTTPPLWIPSPTAPLLLCAATLWSPPPCRATTATHAQSGCAQRPTLSPPVWVTPLCSARSPNFLCLTASIGTPAWVVPFTRSTPKRRSEERRVGKTDRDG